MITIRIMNKFLHGPVWACEHGTGIEIDGFPLVLEDPVVSKLNAELSDMFDLYYCFDDNESCTFDEAKQGEDKDKTLALLAELNNRLVEINDGKPAAARAHPLDSDATSRAIIVHLIIW